MTSRRDFIKTSAALGAGVMLGGSWKFARAFYQTPINTIPLFQTALRGVGPGGIPVAASDGFSQWGAVHYTINVQQYQDQVLPLGPQTTFWGYNPVNPLGGGVQPQRHLGGIIVAKKGQPIQITFNNRLPYQTQSQHIIPNDLSIMGADQGNFRLATHFHGGLVPWISDGGPHTWFDPSGNYGPSAGAYSPGAITPNIYQGINSSLLPGQAEYFYPLNQSARFGWYHDHALGITRINAYAGVASGLIIRDDAEAYLVKSAGLPPYIETSVLGGTTVRELPLVFQDKIFVGTDIASADPSWTSVVASAASGPGSLWYAHVYDTDRWDQNPVGPTPDPSVIPEFFGDTMLVNGTAYPTVPVEPRRYRLRLLNACNARFLNLQLYVADASADGITLDGSGNPTNKPFVSRLYGGSPAPQLLQIGTEGGFLRKPTLIPTNVAFNPITMKGSLLVAPAERPDVLVDFGAMAGKTIILYNDAPAPFPMGDPVNDYFPGWIGGSPVNMSTSHGFGPNSRVLMRFVVGTSVTKPRDAELQITPREQMPGIDPPLPATGFSVRRLTLNEDSDEYGRLIQRLGTLKDAGPGLPYDDPATEVVKKGTRELWEVFNTTGDVHPMHWHLVNVHTVNRQPFDAAKLTATPQSVVYTGPATAPNANELGWKETVPMYPGTVTRVMMKFDLPATPFTVPASPRTGGNEYVWHCHILEHEEHDMMRPLIVT
jgi:spore coat protein A